MKLIVLLAVVVTLMLIIGRPNEVDSFSLRKTLKKAGRKIEKGAKKVGKLAEKGVKLALEKGVTYKWNF